MESITLQTGDNIITSGDILGKLQFAASAESDTVGRLLSASIYAKSEGAFTSAGNPCALVFSTSSNDTNPTIARLRVSEDGHFAPMSNGAYDLGLSSMAFRNAYISEGVILSDNTPSSTTNKLYNNGGSLYFNGSPVGGGGGSYTAGSGITIDSSDSIHVFGGTGNFKSIELDSPATIVGVPIFTMGTATSSQPFTISQTWNNAAVGFNGVLVDITDTSSLSSSVLADFKVDSTSKIRITKNGVIEFENDTDRSIYTPEAQRIAITANASYGAITFVQGGIYASSSGAIGFRQSLSDTTSADIFLYRDAAGILAQRRGSTHPQTFRIYNNYTSSTSYERAKLEWSSDVLNIGTELGSTGGAVRPLSIQTSGTDRMRFDTDGDIGIGTTTPDSQLHVVNDVASDVAVIVQGATSQSTNIQEWQNNSSQILSQIDSNGALTANGVAVSGASGGVATLVYDSASNNTYTFTTSFGGSPKVIACTNTVNTFGETNSFTGQIRPRRPNTSGFSIMFDPTTGSTSDIGFNSTSSRTLNFLNNATTSGSTKTLTICEGGVSGSTTNITIGSSVSGSTNTTTLYGTLNNNGVLTTDGISSDYYRTTSDMIITESGTSRTLAAADNGKIIRCTSGSAVTITVPTGLDVGFSVTVIQEGLGQVTFSASSTNIRNRQNHTKTAGTYAVVSLIQLTTNNFFLAGDTAL